MGRDWTPKEMYLVDKDALLNRGQALRDIHFSFYNNQTKETEPLYTQSQIEIAKKFSDFAFLYDPFHEMFNKYSEFIQERNVLFAYIESTINLIATDTAITVNSLTNQVKNFFAKNPDLAPANTNTTISKVLSPILFNLPSDTIKKWFNGDLDTNFYYNTKNNNIFGEMIDKTMCEIIKEKCKEFKKGSTHSTQFHSDEVFTTALFLTLNPNFTYERNLDIPDEPNIIVYDKGMGKYDHHQIDNEVRENGIPYASFGKVWRDFSKYLTIDDRLMTKTERDIVERKLVQRIDATDNGKGHDDYSNFITLLNPINRGTKTIVENENDMFAQAVFFAKTVLNRYLENSVEIGKHHEILANVLKTADNGILCVPEYIAIKEPTIHKILLENEIDIVVYPSQRGGFNIQQVPIEEGSFVGRMPFPQEWLGKRGDDLPEHITFCHSGNWLLAIDSETPKEAKKIAHQIANICREELRRDIGKEAEEVL